MSLFFNLGPAPRLVPEEIEAHVQAQPDCIQSIFPNLDAIYGQDRLTREPVAVFKEHFTKVRQDCESHPRLRLGPRLRQGALTDDDWVNIFFGRTDKFLSDCSVLCSALAINFGHYGLIQHLDNASLCLELALKVAVFVNHPHVVTELLRHQDKIKIDNPVTSGVPCYSWHDALFSCAQIEKRHEMINEMFSSLQHKLFQSQHEALLMDSFSQSTKSNDAQNLQAFLSHLPDSLMQRHPNECKWAVKGALKMANRECLLKLASKHCFSQHFTQENIIEALEANSHTRFNNTPEQAAHVQFMMERWGHQLPYDFTKSLAMRFAFYGHNGVVDILLPYLMRHAGTADQVKKDDNALILAQLKQAGNNHQWASVSQAFVCTEPQQVEIVPSSNNPIMTSWAVKLELARQEQESSNNRSPRP